MGFLRDLAYTPKSLEHFEDIWTNAVAALDTPAARELLLSFVDSDLPGVAAELRLRREDVMAARIADLAKRDAKVEARSQGRAA